jgi:hypothetical protein
MSLMSQFTGDAFWSVGVGVVSVVVPFVFNRVFFFLPLIGLFYGIRAIRRGRVVGGIVGVVLNVIAGLIAAVSLFVK